jgi:uncharacterized protein (TIGR02444 family)
LSQTRRDPDGSDAVALSTAADSFWRFSLSLYARPGVAEALIALQDRDNRDVNMTLFALWSGAVQRRRLAPEDVVAAEATIASLRGDVVKPIRRLRRKLKSTPGADVQALRRRVLGLELATERAVQKRLAATLGGNVNPVGDHERLAAAKANLLICLGAEVAGTPEANRLCAVLAALTRS